MHLPSTMAAVLLGDGVADGVAEAVAVADGVTLAALASLLFAGENTPRAAAMPTPTAATSTTAIALTDSSLARLARCACRSSRRSCACLASLRWRCFFVATRAFLLLIRSVLRFCLVWQRPTYRGQQTPGQRTAKLRESYRCGGSGNAAVTFRHPTAPNSCPGDMEPQASGGPSRRSR